ncbi:MAG: exosortase family protein XrtF [Bacteroidota bacterium]|jgi:exosortase family protein XrtF|nr:exosortase family protein XrtF [Bacteroidota bacterium]MDX5427221.1 exosortase family protein XrtF [Bacteroidota bacterium]
MLQDFKPTLVFLLKFAIIFGVGSWAYGAFIGHYNSMEPPQPDPVTAEVAYETADVMTFMGYEILTYRSKENPYVQIYHKGKMGGSISVYEGCNGINIMILFVAFVVAFGGSGKDGLWFIPVGLVSIHIFNIIRLVSLSVVGLYSESAFHFLHKYAFTAVIYAFVLILWYLWVKRYMAKQKRKDVEETTVD